MPRVSPNDRTKQADFTDSDEATIPPEPGLYGVARLLACMLGVVGTVAFVAGGLMALASVNADAPVGLAARGLALAGGGLVVMLLATMQLVAVDIAKTVRAIRRERD